MARRRPAYSATHRHDRVAINVPGSIDGTGPKLSDQHRASVDVGDRRHLPSRSAFADNDPSWCRRAPTRPSPVSAPAHTGSFRRRRTRPSHRCWVTLLEAGLVPIRVRRRARAGGIKPLHLLRCQRPADGAEVLAQLLLVAGADDHAGHGRALQQPVQRDLRHALACLLRDGVERVDDGVDIFIVERRSGIGRLVQAACLGQRLAAPDLAGETPPAERAPDDRAEPLVEAERH